jgi:hypothetical protein
VSAQVDEALGNRISTNQITFDRVSFEDIMNPTKRHEDYRSFGGYKSFAEADAELRAYWQSRTLEERMEALETLRIANYGEATINAGISRVFGVPKPSRS